MTKPYAERKIEWAEDYAHLKLHSKLPDFPQTFRKHDLKEFAKEDALAGAKWRDADLLPRLDKIYHALDRLSYGVKWADNPEWFEEQKQKLEQIIAEMKESAK